MTSNSVRIAKNLIFGFVLLRTFSFGGLQKGVALFGFLDQPFFYQLRWALGLIIVLLWLTRRFERSILSLTAFSITLQFCLSYSNVGAFSFTPFFLFIFALLFLSSPTPNRESTRAQAALLIAIIFFSSALQKLNPLYLSGHEFQKNGSFVSFLQIWWPSFEIPTQSLIPSVLATGSVIAEFLIGFGIIYRPNFFAHIVVFFLLILALLHPPVLYVYFFFLPLIVLISPSLDRMYGRTLGKDSAWVPVGIALLLKLIAMESTDIGIFPFLTYGLTTVLLITHLRTFLRERGHNEMRDEKRIEVPKQIRTTVLPALIAFTVVGSAFFLPSPLGFSMFAARRFRIPSYEMKIESALAC